MKKYAVSTRSESKKNSDTYHFDNREFPFRNAVLFVINGIEKSSARSTKIFFFFYQEQLCCLITLAFRHSRQTTQLSRTISNPADRVAQPSRRVHGFLLSQFLYKQPYVLHQLLTWWEWATDITRTQCMQSSYERIITASVLEIVPIFVEAAENPPTLDLEREFIQRAQRLLELS